jgi:hypothetical protein
MSWQSARKLRHLFVLCSALHLPAAAKLVSKMNREHKLQALFVRNDSDLTLLPQMLERAKLRAVRNILIHSDSSIPRRVLAAWQHNAQAELIANATVAGDRLIAISCEPMTYELGFEQIQALSKVPASERCNVEIAQDGSFIWWPSRDGISTWTSTLSEAWLIRAGAGNRSVCEALTVAHMEQR